MSLIVPLPKSMQDRVPTHPGLFLDKYIKSWDPHAADRGKLSERVQKPALEHLVQLTRAEPQNLDFKRLRDRRRFLFSDGKCTSFCCTTTGPLTLHLARASALENAGICLHPLYGFVYLPGSGLKGMAHAYACEVWLPAQADQAAAWRLICDVFGWAPSPWLRDLAKHYDQEPPGGSAAGSVVFHDAWPRTWPQLIVDIVNNHHPKYYQEGEPPGDWENPVPVYFLAVPPGQTFEFALAPRRDDVPQKLVDLAKEWLLGALCHLGAGAKTAAGYGGFKPEKEELPAFPVTHKHATFECTLELVTPAFLAGATQKAEDCDLRPATLRGLLRWWWRTMHSGFVDIKTLRAMEAAIWGDTDQGGAVRVEVVRVPGNPSPGPYDRITKAQMSPQEKTGPYGIPNSDPKKTTQGLWYSTFGMEPNQNMGKAARFVIEPGCKWMVRAQSRGWGKLSAQAVLNQAKAALWLLCQFGGAGAKARKGFGSLQIRDDGELTSWTLDQCTTLAKALRQVANVDRDFKEQTAESPALRQLLGPVERGFPWPSAWQVLDQVGFAVQQFAKSYAHQLEKKALGLPHRVGSPTSGVFRPTGPVRVQIAAHGDNARHASPIHLHLDRTFNGYLVRAIAFPAKYLPDLETSRSFLKKFLEAFERELERRAALPPRTGLANQARGHSTPLRGGTVPPAPTGVTVRFLGPHATLKDAYWVQEEGKNRGLIKYGKKPDPLPAPDSMITVYRTNNNPSSPEFRWDAPPPSQDRGRGGRGPQGPKRR